jgi:hypothetical protein
MRNFQCAEWFYFLSSEILFTFGSILESWILKSGPALTVSLLLRFVSVAAQFQNPVSRKYENYFTRSL